jgi:hypothetical protein
MLVVALPGCDAPAEPPILQEANFCEVVVLSLAETDLLTELHPIDKLSPHALVPLHC